MLMRQHLVLRMKKWNNFMILKEQWLIVTPNIKSLQEIPMQKLELKQKKKTSQAFGIRERNERGDRLIEFAKEHKLIVANTQFQKKNKKQTNKKQQQQTKKTTTTTTTTTGLGVIRFDSDLYCFKETIAKPVCRDCVPMYMFLRQNNPFLRRTGDSIRRSNYQKKSYYRNSELA